ncbi:hypothetical protein [Salegentibacter mishustinae]|uniref:hypothetical protein n=1 Tax=Salegentibacter mishustinae TaxID=270918 RepID=UPI0024908E45|nr:hypothetical protein [Salegentibacter mishustinae]
METSTKILEFTRKEFYNLVWKKSLKKISKDFDITYTDIRKITKDYEIPVPPNGYWRKLDYGKQVHQIPLPFSNNKSIKIIPGQPYKPSPKNEFNALVHEIENDSRLNLTIPKKLPKKPHPIISETIKYYKGQYPDKTVYNSSHRYPLGPVRVAVNGKYEPRALRILDTFIKSLEDRGHSLIFGDFGSYIVIKGVEFNLEIQEKRKRVQVKTTYGFRSELESTGILYIKIDLSYHHKTWSDSKTTNLENKLSAIIAYLETQAEKRILENIENAIERKIRKGKDAIGKAEKEKRDLQIKKLEKIISDSKLWHQAEEIRKYMHHLKNRAPKENDLSPVLEKTLEFGFKKADWLDPTIEIEDKIFEEIDPQYFFRNDFK